MKRNLTLIRQLLLSYGGYSPEITECYSKEEYTYHQWLLVNAGYKAVYYYDDEPRSQLTHTGQEVAALIANADLWDAAWKHLCNVGFVSAPFDLLLELMRKMLKEQSVEQVT